MQVDIRMAEVETRYKREKLAGSYPSKSKTDRTRDERGGSVSRRLRRRKPVTA